MLARRVPLTWQPCQGPFDASQTSVVDCGGSTGSGAARLARRVRDAEAGGSNPLSPTTGKMTGAASRSCFFVLGGPADLTTTSWPGVIALYSAASARRTRG